MAYFKLVCTYAEKEEWMFEEFLQGRVRFGWSPPGSDLQQLKNKSKRDMTNQEKTTWRYSQFLINRLQKGDTLIIQHQQPMRKFLMAEVTEGYEYDSREKPDFNHIIHVNPITDNYIPLDSKYIPHFLQHDLTKRGQYYEIYPERSINELDDIIKNEIWKKKDLHEKRTDSLVIHEISQQWPSQNFETFVANLIEQTPGMEVKRKGDSRKGWDLLIKILDPVTGDDLIEEVPVQCKNYSGDVKTDLPIKDLERCLENSNSNIVYLFIMGNLTEQFIDIVKKKEQEMSKHREVTLKIVDQDRIAEMYLNILEREQE